MDKKILLLFIVGIIMISFVSASFDWSSGMISYWDFNEGTGTNVDDKVYHINNGTTINSPAWVQGILGTGLNISNSSSQYVNVSGTDFVFDEATDSFSLSAWVYLNKTGTYRYIAEKDENWGITFTSANKLSFAQLRTTTGAYHNTWSSDLTITDTGVWKHIVVTYNGTGANGVAMYVNGTQYDVTNGAYNSEWGNNAGPLLIARDVTKRSLNGGIDELGIWNRTLTSSEVGELYNAGLGIPYGEDITINPTLLFPTNASTISDVGSNFTSQGNNISSFSYQWKNITYFIWNESGIVNQTFVNFADADIMNETLYIDDFSLGDYKWNTYNCYGNITFNNCTWTSNGNFTFEIIPFSTISETFNNFTTEGSTETFTANFSFLAGYRLSSVKFIYNSTEYISSFTEYDTGYYYVNKDIIIPQISTNTNITFYWALTLENGFAQNTTFHNQTIRTFTIDDCSVYTYQLLNLTLYDEDSQTFLVGADDNTSIKLSILLSSLDSSTEIVNYSHFYNQTNPARVCMQNPLNASRMRMDGTIEYSSSNRFTEFYYFQNYTLTNTTDDAKIYLYNLNSSKGQEYKIVYKDANFIPIEGALLNIQRKYIDEGIFKTTEIPKTGTEGYTIGHLVSNDVIYNIIVSKEGQILATFTDVIADCQNPLLSTCQINLNSYSSSNFPTDFTNLNDISFTMSYNKTEREISVLYNIISGVTSVISLNVTLFDTLGTTPICNDTLYSSGGTLSCTIPLSFGNTTVIANLYKDGSLIGYSIIKLYQNPIDIYGTNIIFIALLVFLTIAGIGATSDNPMTMGIILLVGSIVMVSLNIIYSPSWLGAGATILWFILAVVLVLIKGGSRQ